MKHILFLFLVLMALPAAAQKDKDERKEDREERRVTSQAKVDYNVFRRQMLTLPEYSELRRKATSMQHSAKSPVKVIAYVDSLADAEDGKSLTGFISVSIADNATNLYEVTYDRLQKKIVFIKPTGETLDEGEEQDAKPGSKQPTAKKKKKGEDDDEEEEEKEKPAKGKQKDDDD